MKNYEPFALAVNITADLPVVEVMHDGQKVTIIRNQNQQNTIKPDFALTSRECPPFCIQPSQLAPGVTTIAELEVLDALQKISDGDRSLLVIDSRTKNWVEKGVIPGTVNIPWDALEIGKAEPAAMQAILKNQLGVKRQGIFGISTTRRHWPCTATARGAASHRPRLMTC